MKGQGAINNVKNRFEKTETIIDWKDAFEEEPKSKKVKFTAINAKTIINTVKSIDLPFEQSINPYQGCEHGCSYCFARPSHEFWALNAGVDFERKIMYKPNAAVLLENQLKKKNYIPKTIVLSGNTDCYQPAELKLKITRSILEICLKYKNPVSIITKNALLIRDLDIFIELQKHNLISVAMSITTLDENLRRILEPRTSSTSKKINAVKILADNQIPVSGMMSPIISGLNNHEILEMANQMKNAGASGFYGTVIRLNDAVEPIFIAWLDEYFPDRKNKILNQIKELHNGKLGNKTPSERLKGAGAISEIIHQNLKLAQRKYFENAIMPKLNTADFVKNFNGQLSLF